MQVVINKCYCGFFLSETFNSVCFHVVSFFVSEPELTDSVQRRSSNLAFCEEKLETG